MELLLWGLLLACGVIDDGSGACEKEYEGSYWCHEFHDIEGGSTGEEICEEQWGTWFAGDSCGDIGYPYDCEANVWASSAGSCPPS